MKKSGVEMKQILQSIDLEDIKKRGWDFAVDSIVITAPRKKWDGKRESTPILYVNTAFEKITGYSSKEIVGRDPRFLQGELTDPNVVKNIRSCLRANTVFRGETYNYRKDGTPFIMTWHIEPILDKHGKTIAFLAIQQDITRTRELEAQEKAIQALKNNFVRLTSHQLRTPISAARWGIEVAKEETTNPQVKQGLEDVLLNIEMVSRRLQVMLNAMSINDDERITETNDLIKLSDIFKTLNAETSQLQSQEQVRCEFQQNVQLMIRSNREVLESALLSIIVNSIVYSKPNSVVSIMVKKTSDYLLLIVKDQGIGIAKKDLEALKTPFLRGETASKTWTDGFGVELFLARKRLEEIGADLTISSLGRWKGVEVTITIPLKQKNA